MATIDDIYARLGQMQGTVQQLTDDQFYANLNIESLLGKFTSNTSVQSNVAGVALDTVILASNTNRTGAMVFNDSNAILYLLLAVGTASPTLHSVQLIAQAYFEVPFNYTGVIKGIWASATGSARVTEMT